MKHSKAHVATKGLAAKLDSVSIDSNSSAAHASAGECEHLEQAKPESIRSTLVLIAKRTLVPPKSKKTGNVFVLNS